MNCESCGRKVEADDGNARCDSCRNSAYAAAIVTRPSLAAELAKALAPHKPWHECHCLECGGIDTDEAIVSAVNHGPTAWRLLQRCEIASKMGYSLRVTSRELIEMIDAEFAA